MSNQDNPAGNIARAFGGDARVAVALCDEGFEIGSDAVRKWRAPREKGGGGGLVPAKYFAALLSAANRLGVELTPDMLVGVTSPSSRRPEDVAP